MYFTFLIQNLQKASNCLYVIIDGTEEKFLFFFSDVVSTIFLAKSATSKYYVNVAFSATAASISNFILHSSIETFLLLLLLVLNDNALKYDIR